MRFLALAWLVYLSALIFPAGALAATYYVANAGNDANAGTSESSPWQSLSKANSSTIQAGDTIKFKRGDTWTGQFNISRSGTASAPITYTAYGSGAAPIITNPGGGTCGGNNTGKFGIYISGDYIIAENFRVTQVGESCVHTTKNGDHALIRNNELDNCGIGVKMYGHYGRAHNNNIHDLTLVNAGYGAVGVWFFGGDNKFDHNSVNGAFVDECTPYGTEGGAAEIWTSGQENAPVHNVEITYNTFTNTNGIFEIGGGASNVDGHREPTSNILVAYNKIYNPKGLTNVSLHLTDDYRPASISNLRFENNTIVINNVFPRDANLDRRVMWYTTNGSIVPTPEMIIMKNNIFWLGSDVDKFQDSNRNNIALSNNLFFTQSSGTSLGLNSSATGTVLADPMFVNLNGIDYHLQSGSPAINKGLNLGYTQDHDGNPISGLPDMGAYEYQGSGGGAPPTPSPTPSPGVSPSPSPSASPAAKPGDASGDNRVDGLDYVIWLNHFGQTVSGAGNGDFDNNNHVDGVDYVIWLNHYEG